MIYICIPAHDERETIGVLLWKIRQVMSEFRRDYHALVLDDASTDGTGDVLAPYLKVMPLTVVRHERRQGYARSLEWLLREAVSRAPYPKRDCVVTLQADFTDDAQEIVTLVKRIEGGVDLVNSAAAVPEEEAPLRFRMVRGGARLLARRLRRWPAEVSDPLSGFRAYRVVSLQKALEAGEGRRLLNAEGWAANVELLQAVAPHARRVEEVPIRPWYSRRRRDSRMDAVDAARAVWAYLRGRVTGDGGAWEPAELEERKPESVLTEGRANGARKGARSDSRSGRGRSGRSGRTRGEGSRSRGSKSRSGSGGGAGEPAAEQGGAGGSGRRKRRRGRRKSGGQAERQPEGGQAQAGGGGGGGGEEGAGASAPASSGQEGGGGRSRSGRRRGGRRRGSRGRGGSGGSGGTEGPRENTGNGGGGGPAASGGAAGGGA